MIVFLIPVRHHESVKDYEQVWGLLNNTLMSMAAQDCSDWHAMVCTSKKLPVAGALPHRQITFVEHTGNRICHNPPGFSEADIAAQILDMAERRRVCLEECYKKKLSPKWYFMADADDYVASNLVSTILSSTEPRHMVVTLDTGIMLDVNTGTYATINNFHQMCGTSIAINASFIHSAREHDAVNDFLGNPTFYHMLAGKHCGYCSRHSLAGIPRAAYVQHDQNYGQNLRDYSEILAGAEPLTPEICELFTIPMG